MKKNILIILFIFFISTLSAQKIKFSGDFMIEQNFALNDQYRDKEINDALRSMSITFLTGKLNMELLNGWGIYTKLGIGVSKSGNNVNTLFNKYNEYNFDGYVSNLYVRNSTCNFKYPTNQLSIGISKRLFSKNKWTLKPNIGIGFEMMRLPELSYNLKEEGTNKAYHVDYKWNTNTKEFMHLGFLNTEIALSRSLSKGIDLRFAANYRFYFTRSDFSSQVTNYYTDELVRNHQEKGNYQHTIGLSVGISIK